MLAAIDADTPRRNEDPVACMMSLLDDSDSREGDRRKRVAMAMIVRACFDIRAAKIEARSHAKGTAIAINNLARALGAK